MRHKDYFFISTILLLVLFFAGCSDEDEPKIAATDYSVTSHWARISNAGTKPVDVFFIYPTTWRKTNQSDPNFCAINFPQMLATVEFLIEDEASVFETVGNLYVPYYRQSPLDIITMPAEEKLKILKAEPVTDVIAAFDYFIKHYNKGRPYIIASHSQGSNIGMYLMSEYMAKNPDVYSRMVASYLIGYDITPTYMSQNPHLKFAESATDTKVIISYNTEAPVLDGPNPLMTDGIGLCINPLTWTRTETRADASHNLGVYIRGKDGKPQTLPGFADAQVNLTRGTLICSTIDPIDYYNPEAPVPKGVLHGQDYSFYYFNLRKNAQDRVDAYWHAHLNP